MTILRLLTVLLTLSLTFTGKSGAATTVTELLKSGPTSKKKNLVVIGDGFQSGADQTIFNDYVNNVIMNGTFGEGPVWESANAFNIYRINIDSNDSGVSKIMSPGCTRIGFKRSYSNTLIALATKVTHNGGDGGWLRLCNQEANNIGLVVDEDQRNDTERGHIAEGAGVVLFSQAFDATIVQSGAASWKMESGTVNLPRTVAGATNVTTVNFRQPYSTNPVVFVLPSSQGDDPASIRIKNVTKTQFQVIQVEPPLSDGPHEGMTIHYLAIESGRHRLPSGTVMEAGTLTTSQVQYGAGVTGAEGWSTVNFSSTFGSSPTVLAQIQTMNNETGAPPGGPSAPWLTTALQNVNSTNVQVALERSEVGDGVITQAETIGYLAVTSGHSSMFTDNTGVSVNFTFINSVVNITGWDDANVWVTRDTALGYRYSGDWDRCWMEAGPSTISTLNTILDAYTPGWNYVAVVLNEPGFGGCASGTRIALTLGGAWSVVSHELGHMVGNLADEYCRVGTYNGTEPGQVNVTINTDRNTLKWKDFVNPTTPIPTGVNANAGNGACTGYNQGAVGAAPAGWSNSDDAGLFEGGRYNDTGMYRPVINGRMRGNTPPHSPVGYDKMKNDLDPFHEYTYQESYVGDFTGDGRDDLVIHNANSLALYQSAGTELEPIWVATGKIVSWQFTSGDRFFVGDFNNDGRDDLFVFNAKNWIMPYFGMLRSTGSGFEIVRRFDRELPGWDDMKRNDQFFVADFNGDGRDDIYVFNGRDWSMGYLEMLRSTGTSLAYVRRYDRNLPGWGEMKKNDKFYVAEFNNDNNDDLYIFNGRDWSIGYLQMLRSTGTTMAHVRRFDKELPGWDDMKRNDQFFVGDFNNDGRDDLYVFNGHDWSIEYLQMLRSAGTNMVNTRRYDGDVPGWNGLASNDHYFVGDINGDGRDDLYVVNTEDWVTEYLGTLRSSGTSLSGGWQSNWIGSWNLGSVDRFLVANFNGGAGWDDLFVRNDNWFGLLRSQRFSVQLNAIYPKWIHRHGHHRLGWW